LSICGMCANSKTYHSINFRYSNALKTVPCLSAACVQTPKLITVSTSDTLSNAFKKLCDNGILAVPVVDTLGTPRGTLSIIDIICHLDDNLDKDTIKGSIKRTYDFFDLVITKKELSSKLVATIDQIGELDPVLIIDDDKNMHDVVQLMVVLNGRRVLVQNRESQVLIGLITQTGLLQFLWKNRMDLNTTFWDTKISEMSNLSSKDIVTVKLMSSIISAFKTMRELGISACGVVDDSGKLVGNISAADIKLLGYDLSFFQALAFTVNEYIQLIKEKTGRKTCVVSVKEGGKETVGDVVQKLLENHIHRLYIVDADEKPVGLISMTDILVALGFGTQQ